jgi:hypothetical protein
MHLSFLFKITLIVAISFYFLVWHQSNHPSLHLSLDVHCQGAVPYWQQEDFTVFNWDVYAFDSTVHHISDVSSYTSYPSHRFPKILVDLIEQPYHQENKLVKTDSLIIPPVLLLQNISRSILQPTLKKLSKKYPQSCWIYTDQWSFPKINFNFHKYFLHPNSIPISERGLLIWSPYQLTTASRWSLPTLAGRWPWRWFSPPPMALSVYMPQLSTSSIFSTSSSSLLSTSSSPSPSSNSSKPSTVGLNKYKDQNIKQETLVIKQGVHFINILLSRSRMKHQGIIRSLKSLVTHTNHQKPISVHKKAGVFSPYRIWGGALYTSRDNQKAHRITQNHFTYANLSNFYTKLTIDSDHFTWQICHEHDLQTIKNDQKNQRSQFSLSTICQSPQPSLLIDHIISEDLILTPIHLTMQKIQELPWQRYPFIPSYFERKIPLIMKVSYQK